MWRDKLIEIKKEKGISTKILSERSGLTVETIARILNSKNAKTEDPRINTIAILCESLGVELWEIFYLGDKSFVDLQAEIVSLKSEHDALVAENAVQKAKIETLKDKVDTLKDDIIAVHNYYTKLKSNN